MEFENELEKFPSHFKMDGIDMLSAPKMRSMVERINEDKRLEVQDKPWYHEATRDRNLLLFLEFKLCSPMDSYGVIEKIKKTSVDYPKDIIALANLAWIYFDSDDKDEVETCLGRLKSLDVWSRVYADAEVAYACTRMGPKFYLKGKELFEKVLSYRQYPGIQNVEGPKFIERLIVMWSFGAALINSRILNPTVFGDYHTKFDCGPNGDPEKIMRETWYLLRPIFQSQFGEYISYSWIVLRNTFMSYKRVHPKHLRYLKLERLVGYSADACLQKAVSASKTISRGDPHALYMIGNAYRKWPLKNTKMAEEFLLAALRVLPSPCVLHHLALVSVDKWLLKFSDRPNRNNIENIRDPGNNLLLQAIKYLQDAIKHTHQTNVQFLTDLARYKYSYAPEPLTPESKSEILATMNQSLVSIKKYSEATTSDQAYAYLHLGMFHEAFGDLKKSRNYLKLSVQKSVSCGQFARGFSKLMAFIEKECRDNPGVALYKEQAELYEIIHKHQEAIKSYKKVRELGDNSSSILEKLVENFCHVSQYMDARQCLKLLLSNDGSQLLKDEQWKKRFIDVCLKAAQTFVEENVQETANAQSTAEGNVEGTATVLSTAAAQTTAEGNVQETATAQSTAATQATAEVNLEGTATAQSTAATQSTAVGNVRETATGRSSAAAQSTAEGNVQEAATIQSPSTAEGKVQKTETGQSSAANQSTAEGYVQEAANAQSTAEGNVPKTTTTQSSAASQTRTEGNVQETATALSTEEVNLQETAAVRLLTAEENARETAADIYQELITDVMPGNIPPAYSKIVVLSSEYRDDNPKTEMLLKLLRCELGFNEDSCKCPYESHERVSGHYEDFIIKNYIKQTWCCIVHLTDKLLKDRSFVDFLRNCIKFLSCQQLFKGHLVLIDDLTDSTEAVDKQLFFESYHMYPSLKYNDIFGEGIASASSCERIVKGLLSYKE